MNILYFIYCYGLNLAQLISQILKDFQMIQVN